MRALLLFFTFFYGFLSIFSERSSSERSPAPLDAAELLRDAPLYPPLQDSLDSPYDDVSIPKIPLDEPKELKDDTRNVDINSYGDPETSIEDNNLLVTPEEFVAGENDYAESNLDLTGTNEKGNLEAESSDVLETPEEPIYIESNDAGVESILDTDVLDSSDDQEPSSINSDNGFIFASGSNVDLLMDDEARVEIEGDVVLTPEQEIEPFVTESTGDENLNARDPGLPLTVTENDDEVERKKRSSGQEWDKNPKPSRRVKTGDTILNIRGAVRDAIGDAGAAPGPRASSRVDAFVIRPSPVLRDEPRDQLRDARSRIAATVPLPVKLEKELLVEAHAHARIPCDLVNVTNLRWYKDNEQISLATSPGGESTWRDGDAVEIGRASRGHAARWRCAGRDRSGRTVTGEPTRLLIYEPVRSVYLAVDGRRLDAGNTWVPVRDKTVLEVRCVAEGGVPPPDLSWRLLALEPALDHRPYLRIHHTNYSIEGVVSSRVVVTAARELHNATLQCEAKQRQPTTVSQNYEAKPHKGKKDKDKETAHDVLTAKLEIHVTYPPSFVISRWPGFGVALTAGGAAALRCDVDANPPARAAWLRDSDVPASSPPPLEGAGAAGAMGAATLRWAALRTAHAGWYRCRASWLDGEYSSIGYYLNVLAPDENAQAVTESDVHEEPDHQKVEVPLGGNVQLHCPKGSVGCWWRRVVGNSSENWAPAGSHHAHGVLGINSALYEEGGEYRCVGARAPERQRLRELKRVTLRVTGGATATALSSAPAVGGWRLECGACGRNLRVLWLRNGIAQPAVLTPDLAQHCWRAVLLLPEPDEVWCVAVSTAGGAVAVFPRRVVASPSPARHAVRALHAGANTRDVSKWLLIGIALGVLI
ncbi:uncharacterized protein tei [Epargyreus clarus]|uniref:uncharacterized protein tei n=1 Tax=Epargyreus clarus TaxID=520877 RepID=UPI003C2AB6E0